jgi:predicted ATPase/DNA-binding SARP family transcriptional activator
MDLATPQRALRPWRITLFGVLAVQYGDQSIAHFETRRAASLLACLAFYRQKRHPREELIEMLWPEEDLEATRLRFRQVLTSLRKTLTGLDPQGDVFLRADRTFVWVDPHRLTTDVAEFETALKQAPRQETAQARAEALIQAIHLYTGELLPGHYEEWMMAERRRLAETYVSALTDLAELLGSLGDPQAAIEHLRQALRVDGLREETHLGLIRLYAGLGRNAEALVQYREMEQLLWKELRALPSQTSQALIEQVRAGAFVPTLPLASVSSSFASASDSITATPEPIPDVQSRGPLPSSALAAPLTPFFGRQREIHWLVDQLKPASEPRAGHETTTRLVTLTGIGGCGKTRLALETARHLQEAYQGAVWFVPLADKEAGALASTLTEFICGPHASLEGSLQPILTVLSSRPGLLVLDNFEQMIPGGSRVVKTLLERAPSLKCLITSRLQLDLEGEQEYPLAPLPIPLSTATPEHLLEYASIQLFVDRAQRVRPGFVLEAEAAELIVGICTQLEGIPLALELAASWMALLSPAQMRERLKQRFDLLVSRRQDLPERHRSMRATLEWSYRNLEPDLQRFFARLSVFHGGWTLEAAEEIAQRSGAEGGGALDYLGQLRQCSLVRSEETAAGMRFGMLEVVREFAVEQLAAQELEELRQRHQDYYLDLAERAAPHLTGPDQREWLLRLKTDYANLRLLLAESQTPQGNREVGLRLFLALWRFWDVYRHYPEAEQCVRQLMTQLTDVEPVLKARLLEAGGCLACNLWHTQAALVMLEESLSLYRGQGDRQGMARVLCSMALGVRDLGDYPRAYQLFEQCLPILREIGEPFLIGRALAGLAVLKHLEKDHTAAFPVMEQAAAMYRISGHKKGLAYCLNGQGNIAFDQGNMETARCFLERALTIARNIEDSEQIQYSLFRLATVHYVQGEQTAAQNYLQEALSISITIGFMEWEVYFLIWLGALAYDRTDDLATRTYFGEALRICDVAAMPIHMTAVIKCIASLEARRGHVESALRLLSFAAAHNTEELSLLEPLHIFQQIDVGSLRQSVGPEAFARAWEQGREWSWDLAIHAAKEAISE